MQDSQSRRMQLEAELAEARSRNAALEEKVHELANAGASLQDQLATATAERQYHFERVSYAVSAFVPLAVFIQGGQVVERAGGG